MLTLLVGLAFGGAAVYAAYRDQKLGAAIVVGLTVVTVFFLLMEKNPSSATPQTVAPSTPVTTPTPPAQSRPPFRRRPCPCACPFHGHARQPWLVQPAAIGDIVTRAGQRAEIEICFTGHPRRPLRLRAVTGYSVGSSSA
ncbi:hypothetical protein [Streptomyces echinatus]|uniref:Uncharacterized protein n=1 Tax=Streptomyces echinatus TaxID=67293 RepID=A0A7W9Q243_9ACTN|nr:hypothetical protein [Streptomyces echinatus]MBB5932201.1 hypothetical protein [Streptomyces echinatus]